MAGGAVLDDAGGGRGHQQILKGLNKMSLVRSLFVQPGLSRADLANTVQLTKSTVSLLVRELLEEGWLVESEVLATGDLGRRPTPLLIDPSRLVLIGAELGVGGVRAVVTSLTGEVLARSRAGFGAASSAKACVGVLAAVILKLLRHVNLDTQRVLGIGVGVPGGVDEDGGMLRFAPNMGWRDVALVELLHQRLAGTEFEAVPLFVQNEADVAAVGEMEFNRQHVGDPLLFVSVNQGVGAGVIVNGRLLTGHRGFAGEVGHIVLEVGGPMCSCGRLGCAEALIGPRAMVPDVSGEQAMEELRRRVANNDARAVQAVERAGAYLGVLLQNLAAAYDPFCIVLGGEVVELGEVFLRPALRTLEGYARAAGFDAPEIRVSCFGGDAVSVGAAALVRYRLTHSPAQVRPAVVRDPLAQEAD